MEERRPSILTTNILIPSNKYQLGNKKEKTCGKKKCHGALARMISYAGDQVEGGPQSQYLSDMWTPDIGRTAYKYSLIMYLIVYNC